MNRLTTVLAENLGDLAAESRIFEQKTTDVFTGLEVQFQTVQLPAAYRPRHTVWYRRCRLSRAMREAAAHIRTGHKGMIPQFHFL
jgi:hypothetical protein